MKIVRIIGQLRKVETIRDGGGRITLDFGGDSLEEVIELQRFFRDNNIEVAVALTPISEHTNDFQAVEEVSEPDLLETK